MEINTVRKQTSNMIGDMNKANISEVRSLTVKNPCIAPSYIGQTTSNGKLPYIEAERETARDSEVGNERQSSYDINEDINKSSKNTYQRLLEVGKVQIKIR
jgi:hypothetical protein